jgi:hypothetical protein
VSAAFVHELRVRYGECDPQGIVFNANYLLYFDVAFTELWREAVGPWQEMVERGVDAVVAEANLRFRSPPATTTCSSCASSRGARAHQHHDPHGRVPRRRRPGRGPPAPRHRRCDDVAAGGDPRLGAGRLA